MKRISLLLSAAALGLLATAVLTTAQPPQDQGPPQGAGAPQAPPQGGPPSGGMRGMRSFPAPTNLKVLPKDTSGQQVREIMEGWAGSLGVHCDTCHVADPNHIGPNGRPRMNFADDSKPEKQIARLMYTMTQQINADTIKKAMEMDKDGEGTPVTCGTCHRGHKMPEEYVIPKEDHPGGPGGLPPTGAMPGMQTPPAAH